VRLWAHLILKPTCLSNPRLKQLTGHVSNPNEKPITIKAKTQPNDPKPKMVWQPRVNGSQKIKNRADAGTASTTANQVMIECRSTAAIPNRNSRRPPALFWHHRQHVSIAEVIQELGEVDRLWGSSWDWFIDLRDGRQVRIPVDLRSPVAEMCQPEDAITQKLVHWVSSQREAIESDD
jgi:hypothetical protein